jgi:hypothetical protein
VSVSEPDSPDAQAPLPPAATPQPGARPHAARKKHHASVEHRTRGRIRVKVPHAKLNPQVLEAYRETLASIPGIRSVTTRPETGSVVIHYDPNREAEFERHFEQRSNEHVDMAPRPRMDDEIGRMADKIEAEAEFLAAHSHFARATVDFFKAFDRELKLATSNNIDLKIVLAGGLAAYTFLEIGAHAATPMWVTLGLFSLNHFAELHTDHRAELEKAELEKAQADAEAEAQATT